MDKYCIKLETTPVNHSRLFGYHPPFITGYTFGVFGFLTTPWPNITPFGRFVRNLIVQNSLLGKPARPHESGSTHSLLMYLTVNLRTVKKKIYMPHKMFLF